MNRPLTNRRITFNLFNKLTLVSLSKFVSFLTVPLISRALGPEEFGLFNLIFTLSGYGLLLANWGFLASGIRSIASSKSIFESLRIVNSVLSTRIVLWLLGSVILILVILLCNPFPSTTYFYFLAIAMTSTFFTATTIDYFYYAKKNSFLPSLAKLTSKLLVLILVYVWYAFNLPYFYLYLIMLFGVMTECIFMLMSRKMFRKLTLQLNINEVFNLLRNNLFLGLGSKVAFFQNTFPILFIPILLDFKELGIFLIIIKLIGIVTLILQSSNLVLSPWIVESSTQSSILHKKSFFLKSLGISFTLITPIIVILFLFGENIISYIFGSEYESAATLIPLMSFLFLPIWILYMILIGFLNNYILDKVFFKGGLIQISINLVFQPLAIYFFHLQGILIVFSLATFISVIYYYTALYNVLRE